MKKTFIEPEIEILSFLCSGEADSFTPGAGTGADGGNGDDIIFD